MKKSHLTGLLGFIGLLGFAIAAAGDSVTVAYQYDVAGRLTNVSYDVASAIAYDYDVNGNLLERTVTKSLPEPGIPSNVTAVITSTNAVYVSWNSATNALGYELWRATGTNSATQLGTTTNLYYTDAVQTTLTVYYYWVLAYNTSGTNTLTGSGTKAEPVTGSLQTTLLPVGAPTAGAQWRLTSGSDTNWHLSTAIVSNLFAGNYTVTFNALSGWHSPVSQSVTITADQLSSVTGTYTQMLGAVTATLNPEAARTDGRWKLVDYSGTTWYTNGQHVANIPVSIYTATFNQVTGMITPTNQAFTIEENQTESLTGTYTWVAPELTLTNQDATVDYSTTNEMLGRYRQYGRIEHVMDE